MMKCRLLIILLFTITGIASGQHVKVIDELGSPVRDAHFTNEQGDVHAFTDKLGLVNLSSFKDEELIVISRTGFLTLSLSKDIIRSFDNQITLLFDSETIGEVILLTRIDDENLKTTAERRVILHAKEIERLNTQTTADLLEKRAGINVQKSQMGGGSPVIRGFEANRILLVVDGVRMNNAIYRGGHLQNIITIDNASLEQVDIIFGPSNSAYSSDGLGGIIHLKTIRPEFSESAQLSHSYSTRYATANKGISKHYDLRYTGKDFALYSSFSHSDFDDLRMGRYRPHGYSDWGKVFHYIENGEQRINPDPNIQKNTGYSQTDFMQKVIFRVAPNWTLTGNFQFSNSSNIPRFDKLNDYKTITYDSLNDVSIYSDLKYATWDYGPQKRYFSSLQIDHSSNSSLMDSAQFIFAYQDVYESRHVQKVDDTEDVLVDRFENVDIYSFNANFIKKDINYGLEYYYNDVNSRAYLTDDRDTFAPFAQTRYPNGGSSMESWAAYLTYKKHLNNITLNSGLRYTQNNLNALFHSAVNWNLPFSNISYKYKALTGNLSAVYHPNESWKLATILSTGFHAPNIDDTGKLFYKSKILTIPNFDLRPEYAKTIELNITKNIDNRILLNANAYYTHIDDVIMKVTATEDWEIDPDPNEEFSEIKTNSNTGTAEVYGATASMSMRIASNYTLESDYTIIKGRNITNDLPFTHIPPSFGKTAFYADYDKWRASLFVLYNGRKSIEEYDIESGTDNEEESPIEWVLHEESNSMIIEYQGTPGWYTLNLSGMYRFSESFTLQLALENILDQHYKTFASGLSAPGRNFILTLRAKF